MSITYDGQLMKAQKHASLMGPGKAFEVIQSETGCAIFFSISDDGGFYAARELDGTETGWKLHDLMETVRKRLPKAIAKAFDIAQEMDGLTFSVVLVVNDRNQDLVMVCHDHENSEKAWAEDLSLVEAPFNAEGATITKLQVSSVQSVRFPSRTGGRPEEIIIADVTCDTDPMRRVDRYFLQPSADGKTHNWKRRVLPDDLQSITMNRIGRRSNDPVSGTYTMGKFMEEVQLNFVPFSNPFRPRTSPKPVVLDVPGARCMDTTTVLEGEHKGCTSLFVGGALGVHYFAPESQYNSGGTPTGTPILASPITRGTRLIKTLNSGKVTSLWAIGANDSIYYTKVDTGKEANASAWSLPVPIFLKADTFAFYTGKHTGAEVVFAHHGDSVSRLSQTDSGTWLDTAIILPTLDISHQFEFDSYTTRVHIRHANGSPAIQKTATVKSASAVGAYVNGIFRHLLDSASVQTDFQGNLTIIQQASGLIAPTYTVSFENTTITVEPHTGVLDRLTGITTVEGLDQLQVTDPISGAKTPLIKADEAGKKEALRLLQCIKPAKDDLAKKGGKHGHGIGSGSTFISAGDFFRVLAPGIENAPDILVEVTDGIWHFVCKIGGEPFRIVLDGLGAVGNAIVWVFQKLGVAAKDLINALSWFFDWDDIKRTHEVLRSLVHACMNRLTDEVDDWIKGAADALRGLDKQVRTWSGLPDNGDPVAKSFSSGPEICRLPQTNWSLRHFEEQANKIEHDKSASGSKPDFGITADFLSHVKATLSSTSNAETLIGEGAMRDLVDCFKDFESLTPIQLVQRLSGILVSFAVESVENGVVTILKLLKEMVKYVFAIAREKIEIPILTPLYKRLAGADLTIIDLMCLVAAIPVTLIVKAAIGREAFSPEATKSFTEAGSWQQFFALLSPKPTNRNLYADKVTPLDAIQSTSESNRLLAAKGINVGAAYAWVFSIASGGTFCYALTACLCSRFVELPQKKRPHRVFGCFQFVTYAMFVTPNLVSLVLSSTWDSILDTVMGGVTLLKVIGDSFIFLGLDEDRRNTAATWYHSIGPTLDVLLNAAWLTCPIARATRIDYHAENLIRESQQLNVASSFLADLGTMAWGVGNHVLLKNPTGRLGFQGGAGVIAVGALSTSAATAGLGAKLKELV